MASNGYWVEGGFGYANGDMYELLNKGYDQHLDDRET